MTEATSLPPRATYPGAEADVLSWLSPERDPRIERSFVVRGSDFVDLWVDSPAYEDGQLLFRDAGGGTTLMPGQVIDLGLDDAPVIVIEASTDGIDLRHPWPAFSQGDFRVWYCEPAKKNERQRIVAFIHGETGELIGAAPLPASNVPTALEELSQRGARYEHGRPALASQSTAPERRSGVGVTPNADGSRRAYEATHVMSNVWWSTDLVSGVDPDLDFVDAHLLWPVLAAIDDADGLTPADLDAVVVPRLVTVERISSVNTRAGSFSDCWLVTTVINGANAAATWYCRGPGIVRREVPGCGSGNPYGSYSAYELVDWNAADAPTIDADSGFPRP